MENRFLFRTDEPFRFFFSLSQIIIERNVLFLLLFIYFLNILNFCFILILSQMATVAGPDGRLHYVYTISGVRVEFPAKAYPSQIAMMDKVRDTHACIFLFIIVGEALIYLCVSCLRSYWDDDEASRT